MHQENSILTISYQKNWENEWPTWVCLALIRSSFWTLKASCSTFVTSNTCPPIFSAALETLPKYCEIRSSNAKIDGSDDDAAAVSSSKAGKPLDPNPVDSDSSRATADSSRAISFSSISLSLSLSLSLSEIFSILKKTHTHTLSLWDCEVAFNYLLLFSFIFFSLCFLSNNF